VPFPENQFQQDVSPKSEKRLRTLKELKANEDLSLDFKKKKKIWETVVHVMNETTRV